MASKASKSRPFQNLTTKKLLELEIAATAWKIDILSLTDTSGFIEDFNLKKGFLIQNSTKKLLKQTEALREKGTIGIIYLELSKTVELVDKGVYDVGQWKRARYSMETLKSYVESLINDIKFERQLRDSKPVVPSKVFVREEVKSYQPCNEAERHVRFSDKIHSAPGFKSEYHTRTNSTSAVKTPSTGAVKAPSKYQFLDGWGTTNTNDLLHSKFSGTTGSNNRQHTRRGSTGTNQPHKNINKYPDGWGTSNGKYFCSQPTFGSNKDTPKASTSGPPGTGEKQSSDPLGQFRSPYSSNTGAAPSKKQPMKNQLSGGWGTTNTKNQSSQPQGKNKTWTGFEAYRATNTASARVATYTNINPPVPPRNPGCLPTAGKKIFLPRQLRDC
ncbi:hypothetical protein ABW20_dc0105922 [Dactylellina cionopaga]|nr:hypothetical protein ABW20_dc0105922 [Dactylellina cionopaga]